ncbi:MAG: sugar ABC transporter permease [Pseudobutyrivibrio sp.]|uniref:Sugar ABC transporter permease n=4 Tax=Lachnospiraceae TaxID=186803 RepID=A0A2G3DTB0_9FIRM|nr:MULTISPECIES: sugar ABC transporter permease [Pseudobutyrivibrio]MBE5904139.1 sugar ABC transporter permease [Pseudobutyrivibrio sp.]NEX00425.1 sugar ABC transporter permease [Pseudobutyrivibrio xylanivorans]PHU34258.1 sugar ABC transporter permease [Pseudobutyrivibrio ruminis]
MGLAQAKAKSTAIAATVFLFPALLLIGIFIVYPVIDTFVISGYKWNGISADKVFVGLENWKTLLHDEMFWKSFKHNLIVMVFSIVLQIPLGMLLATFLDAGGKKFNFFKIIWFLPYLMSSVAIAFLFVYALATNGGMVSSFASIIQGKKVTIDLLGTAPNALYTVIGVMAWQFTPFYMVYFIAGYGNIDTTIYEAAIIDGATRWQYIKNIAIPLLGPIFKTACIMSLIGSLKYFDMIWNMTQGGPAGTTELMATYMYKLSFQQFSMGYGSTVAAGMFILITAIALIFNKVFKVKEVY